MKLWITISIIAFQAVTLSADAIETRLVAYPGNVSDKNHAGDGQFGSVAYPYRIGTTEVTNDQYVAFLNSVAAVDTHALYSGGFGITQHSSPSGFSYSAEPNLGNKPVVRVSFWDALRFANWVHNGQPVGVQDSSTTEDGAYTLNGVTNPPIESVSRNLGAKWFLPTENEWYKAAYYQPTQLGGDPDNYWFYPTASNSSPTVARANSVGDVSNSGANVATYMSGAGWGDVTTWHTTSVASAGPLSASFFGTFDQAGNAEEWIEDIHNFSPNTRVVRGGDWGSDDDPMSAAFRNGRPPTEERDHVGFRLATVVPEPSSLVFLILAAHSILAIRRHY